MPRPLIGGFFELELPSGSGGFLDYWRVPADPGLTYGLARWALKALIEALEPGRVWVPAYICRSVSDQAAPRQLRFYPVGEGLTAQVDFLQSSVRPGDVVIGMNYFGCPPGEDFLSLVAANDQVVFVEDCAQTIDTGLPPWGDYRIFSPRKLLGVPDGGILVPSGTDLPPIARSIPRPSVEGFGPVLLRYEDQEAERWQQWHDDYERWQKGLPDTESDRRMSRTTRAILALADPAGVSARRRSNFATLHGLLDDLSFVHASFDPGRLAGFVPFGFPVRFPAATRDRVRQKLWEAGVYAFRHFANLPCPPDEFAQEHRLSSELITLPCDHRYGAEDMARIASIVRAALRAGRRLA